MKDEELFRTPVVVDSATALIQPGQRILCVGSCFAASIGKKFSDALFPAVVNPEGVMYNPVSVLHCVERLAASDGAANASSPSFSPDVAILTYGTNHVYILKETNEVVDNCQKRPASLFREEKLSVDECAHFMSRTIHCLRQMNPNVHVIATVSPIRYHKYGFHGSQLSKATLLLAVEKLGSTVGYFPAYEIMNDELRDYRFYAADMLHPSDQAVDYIWRQFVKNYFSTCAQQYLREWAPIAQALNHRPFNPDAPEYRTFQAHTQQSLAQFRKKWLDA